MVASTIALARGDGSSLLKIPEPTNTASAPSCMASAASAGVAMPPAQNSGTGSQPVSATSCTSGSGAWRRLAHSNSSAESAWLDLADVTDDRAQVAHGLDDVAGAGLALGADHRRALGDPPQRLAEVGGAAHERDVEGELVDVVGLVGRREHLALVDEVDAEGLQDLGLDEVTDAGLGHHRDRHRGLDALDHLADRSSGPRRRRGGCRPGTRSRAITAQAPASSAILACSGVTTSMMTPPFSISARPRLTGNVPVARRLGSHGLNRTDGPLGPSRCCRSHPRCGQRGRAAIGGDPPRDRQSRARQSSVVAAGRGSSMNVRPGVSSIGVPSRRSA